MISFIAVNQDQPAWIWRISVESESGLSRDSQQLDSGKWTTPEAIDLARWIGWSLTEDSVSRWVIEIWHADLYQGEPVVTYTESDHSRWVADVDTADPVVIAIRHALNHYGQHGAQESGEPLSPQQRIEATHFVSGAPTDSVSLPVDYSQNLQTSLKRLEQVLGDDGTPDPRKALETMGDTLVKALRAAIEHAHEAHPGEPFTDCPETAARIAEIAGYYASAWIASQVR